MLRRGAERRLVGISVTAAGVGAGLGLILIPWFGMIGAQAAMLGSNLVELTLAWTWLQRHGQGAAQTHVQGQGA